MRPIASMMGGAALLALAQGCTLQTSGADKFREPIPSPGDASLGVPGTRAAAAAAAGSTQSTRGVKLQGNGGGGGSSDAQFYVFTRDIADSVDWGTAIILGTVVAITDNPPTTIDDHRAVWGPGSANALDPITWKLVVTQVGDREYDYEIDGRPHRSQSEADWKTILGGHGWGKTHPNHKSGWLQFDNDAFKSLDPQRGKDSGTVKVTFDARSYPITIEADVKPGDSAGTWYDVTVTHRQDASGEVDISAHADVDNPKDGVDENAALVSRWDSTGAGRADVELSGGNIKVSKVDASECWSDAYARTYYHDDVNYQPAYGNASSCVFAQAIVGVK